MAASPIIYTRGPPLGRNTIINLAGFALPSLAAVISIPEILSGLGADKFGLLVLAWAAVGYLSVFDLGLGQSLTRHLAKAFADSDETRIAGLMGSALLTLSLLGIFAGTVAFLLVPQMIGVIGVAPQLQADARESFALVALIVPAAILSAGLTGILEAKSRFDLSNAVSVPMGVFGFLGPLVALRFSNALTTTIAVLAAGRIISTIALAVLVWRYSSPQHRLTVARDEIRTLLAFGGWVTVSRLVVPVVGYFDRFAIVGLLSLKALSYYAPPVDMASRLSIVPIAMAKVLLPAISSHAYSNGHEQITRMFWIGVKFSLLLMFPCALVLGVFAEPLLRIWIGAEAAAQGERVLQLYLLYVFINSLSYPAAMLLLGIGKPHISAIIQLVGFPIYVAAVCLVVPQFGIAGAAAVSVARVALDTIAHFYFVRRVFGSLGRQSLPVFGSSAAASALLVVSCISSDFWPLVLAAGLGGGLTSTWFWILTDQDKVWIYKQYAARPRWSV